MGDTGGDMAPLKPVIYPGVTIVRRIGDHDVYDFVEIGGEGVAVCL